MKKHVATSLSVIIFMAAIGAFAALLLYYGFIRFNYPSFKEYPVQGIDVSNHQKEIDWKNLNKKRVRFAIIKATEGGDFKDKSFERNWNEAQKHGVIVGAYHFFTFCKDGKEQALNFIETVPNDSLILPPIIDIESSGNCKLTKSKEELLLDIEVFIKTVEEHYQRKMIIYVIEDTFIDMLTDKFPDNHYWFRGIYNKPDEENRSYWRFWQHSNRGRLNGIDGFVDLNVFKGSEEDFTKLLNDRL